MPINIYNDANHERIAWLCDKNWSLSEQIASLEKWLLDEGQYLPSGRYIADIGFDMRKEANGGGAILDHESLRITGAIGMDIYFSEYPGQLSKRSD